MTPEFVPFAEAEPLLDWMALCDALEHGHSFPAAEIGDTFLYRGDDTALSRSAWIDGLGIAVKTATIFPGNQAWGKPAVGGGVCVFSDADGRLEAVLDFDLVTKWKTAGDSLLAACKLARPDSDKILIVGAGTVARNLREAYGARFPEAKFEIWSRSGDSAQNLASAYPATTAVAELEAAVSGADIISCATMSSDPVIKGDWLRPGQHVDLVGAYRPDMREADDVALGRSSIFVDSRATTIEHIGELKIPLESGAIVRGDVIADFYELDKFRRKDRDITLFKNGGGAHLDLMTARYILAAWQAR